MLYQENNTMLSRAELRRISMSKKRKDGEHTKKTLIECAGRLIADQGYYQTTSKSICQAADTNLAAINYHFGSRENLYAAVLEEVHRYMMNIQYLEDLAESSIPAKKKLSIFMDKFVQNMWEDKSWQIKVWAREVINPSPLIYEIFNQATVPKFALIAKIFSQYTGLPASDPQLYSSMFAALAPFSLVFLARHKDDVDYEKIIPLKYMQEKLAEDLKRFAFAGLDAFQKNK